MVPWVIVIHCLAGRIGEAEHRECPPPCRNNLMIISSSVPSESVFSEWSCFVDAAGPKLQGTNVCTMEKLRSRLHLINDIQEKAPVNIIWSNFPGISSKSLPCSRC